MAFLKKLDEKKIFTIEAKHIMKLAFFAEKVEEVVKILRNQTM